MANPAHRVLFRSVNNGDGPLKCRAGVAVILIVSTSVDSHQPNSRIRDEGYDTTSMDRIAELAGASKRRVYNHFGSKEALFQAVVEMFMEEASALKVIPHDPDSSLEEQLAEFAQAKVSLAQNPAWFGLMKVALGVFIREPELAGAAEEDGKIRAPDPDMAAELFSVIVGGALFWPPVLQGPMDPSVSNRLKTEIVETFLARYRR